MEARVHPLGDDAGAIPDGRGRGRPGDPDREEQSYAIRPSEIEVFADDGFEEESALYRAIEDLRQTDFELIDREAVVVAGTAVSRGEWPWGLMGPAVEERLAVGGAQTVGGWLGGHR